MTEVGPFLETVLREFNLLRSRSFAGDYEGVTHAGIAIVADDTGRVFLTKRAYDETDAPEVRETWEFPGGGLKEGEEPFPGAVREVIEETGWGIPDDSTVVDGWRAENGVYQGFVVSTAVEFPLDGWIPTTEVSDVGWFDSEAVSGLAEVDALRPEMRSMDWTLIFGDDDDGDNAVVSGNEDQMAEDGDYTDYNLVHAAPIPIHGVLAPEDVETGDRRGFKAGAMTARPLRLPFSWQRVNTDHHDGSEVVGSMDRLARMDGLIHWEGALMPSDQTEDFIDLLAFFSRYGVSVDGDKGSLDMAKTQASGVLWFDAVRASGATAVHIPAFHESYVAFGEHPLMPNEGDERYAVLTASGSIIGARGQFGILHIPESINFDRGPGWVTNPKETRRIHDYWTKPGEEGYEKIGWGTPGDFARAKALIGEKIAKNSPSKMRFLNQIIAQWHFDALGYWPATHAKMDRGGASTKHATNDQITFNFEEWSTDDVLVASVSGNRVYPPMSYFDRHPNSQGCEIEEPDVLGFRRTYGYAAEWGVCHIGKDGVCVEVPEDETGEFSDFHKGWTRTSDGGKIRTGLITYGVEHRDADTILAETATQAHFDNLKHAWAAVRCGQDERGIWFSGVVLPTVEEKWLTAIEASGQVSGEWLWGAMRTLLTVNVEGFPIHRSSAVYNDNGEVVALAASAFGTWECGESPADRLEALRQIDAETRLLALRAQYDAERGF